MVPPSHLPKPIVHDVVCSGSTSPEDQGREGILVTTFSLDTRGIPRMHQQMLWKAGPILPPDVLDPSSGELCRSPYDDGPDGVLYCIREKGHDGACGWA